jgi:hypothetical protein
VLSLDSPVWASLSTAYGPASDLPPLLRQVPGASSPAEPNSEPWFSLWSSLCHQSDVYTASFAAVPHILEDASRRQPYHRLEHLHLCGYIEVCRHRPHSPPVPDELRSDYQSALVLGSRLALESLAIDWKRDWLQALMGALAAFRGEPKLGAAIIESQEQDYCPECDALITLPGYDLFLPRPA